jgi:hypothetical protein
MLKRRGLSGIYIFDKFPGEERREPTCVEDCQEETRHKWLDSLEREALINTIDHLCGTITAISDKFGIICGSEE